MKSRGFTLLELVIVMVLIGITAVFGTRFIGRMAETQVAGAERAQLLAGARFTLERLRRELSQAYGPSVYINDDGRCVSFVSAMGSGRYQGRVQDRDATFIIPLGLQHAGSAPITNAMMAIRAPSGEADWAGYPVDLPENVQPVTDQTDVLESLDFAAAVGAADFTRDELSMRYTLIRAQQLRFCLNDAGELWREAKTADKDWYQTGLMLTQVTSEPLFSGYDTASQLLQMELVVAGRDGELELPGRVLVNYAP